MHPASLFFRNPARRLAKFSARLVAAVVLVLGFGLSLAAQTSAPPDPSLRDFVVKYLSAENVYLDGGRADGLRKGDRLMITRGDSVIAVLEIRYVSNSSASCAIVERLGQIYANDLALLSERAPQSENSSDSSGAAVDTLHAPAVVQSTGAGADKKPPARSRAAGTASVQFYSWSDQSPNNLDFAQATMRLNLQVRQLGGKALQLTMRTRGEYDNRTRAYAGSAPAEDWSNRIHELSLTYGTEDAALVLQMGRILPRRLSGAGYIDGALLERRLSASVRLGILGGMRPRWQYQAQAASLQKYGGYVTVAHGNRQTGYFEQTLALSGEYHSGTTSRELLYLQGLAMFSSRWTLSHIAEVDVNRGWRRSKDNSSLVLSNFYATVRYRASRSVALGISYDNRRNYWSYENRTVADSLFDDQLRSGVRGQLNLRLPAGISLYLNSGYRKRSDEATATTSYSMSLTKTGFAIRTISLNLIYSGFDGPVNDGQSYGARLSQNFRSGSTFDLGYSEYRYRFGDDRSRRNRAWEIALYAGIVRHLFLSGSGRLERGDDTDGLGLRTELGYRF
ncbi:MAG: hypothetical protein IT585_12570 [candidate division Zixibacteria bacterium]|nr:hypothetical protein [candidate division Zixibacteria bacterium]